MSAFEQVQAAKRERMAQEADANLTRQQHTDDIQREMMQMAAESGALTPEVMQTFLEQQSAQKGHDNKSVVTPEQSPSSSCPSCGENVQIGWQVCPHCGITL